MRCTSCEAKNSDGLKFCNQCGTPVASRCVRCGFSNAAGAKFCGECGAPLGADDRSSSTSSTPSMNPHGAPRAITVAVQEAGAIPDGERKTVTALFADIKGSMELMEDLEPEEARPPIDLPSRGNFPVSGWAAAGGF